MGILEQVNRNSEMAEVETDNGLKVMCRSALQLIDDSGVSIRPCIREPTHA